MRVRESRRKKGGNGVRLSITKIFTDPIKRGKFSQIKYFGIMINIHHMSNLLLSSDLGLPLIC